MLVRDWVKRHTRDDEGGKNWEEIRKLRCKVCKKTHRELPDTMLPHKHYEADIIESEIDEKEPHCEAADSTIQEWKEWFSGIAKEMDERLKIIARKAEGLFELLKGEDHSPLRERRGRGGGWLAESMLKTINAGYPAYTPSLA